MANVADNLTEYIVFEADQVLTNDHLNEIFDYLDNQERLTRNKFIGIGIVSGLEVSSDGQTTISISKGCGITSEGYGIIFNETEISNYTHYISYPGITEPTDLFFKYIDKQPLPFYEPFCENKNIYQLITKEDASSKANAVQLFSANSIDLTEYVVVLFLEASETDLKNCSMQDCNNNGKKMDFTIRPLLVRINDLPVNPIDSRENNKIPDTAPDVNLPRYNVPYADLNNSDDVLNAFKNIISASTGNVSLVSQIQDAYNWCYAKYGALLNETPFDFSNLTQTISSILKDPSPVHIEYVYDYMNDLIKAYYEFTEKAFCGMSTACCPDETLFPLHLVLGEAISSRNKYTKSLYRQYFIYSPLFSKQCGGTGEIKFLYERMKIMLAEFNFPTQRIFADTLLLERFNFQNRQVQVPVKITPSQYESFPLSQRSVPFYYLNSTFGFDIYTNWSYHKTIERKTGSILSYNTDRSPDASLYAKNPLLYDIEGFNFFRVEGHIGYTYLQALSAIQLQVQQYNLPFDVVAVSADSLSADAKLPECNMIDLETDYRLIVSGFASAIRMMYSFIINIPYPYNADTFITYLDTFDSFMTNTLGKMQDPVDFDPGGTYTKGDFLTRYCGLDVSNVNTFGFHYLHEKILFFPVFSNVNILKALKTVKPALKKTAAPEATITSENLGILNLDVFFNSLINTFIGNVDALMGYLLTNDVTSFDAKSFNSDKFSPFITGASSFKHFLFSSMESAVKTITDPLRQDILLDEFIDEAEPLFSSTIEEKLITLKNEYANRLSNYQAQLNFLNYFKKHPGLEHKAGVPKGGTFVLVYHQDPPLPAPVPDVPAVPAVDNNRIMINANSFNLLREFMLKNSAGIGNITNADIENVLVSSSQPPVSQYNLSDGEVIADFYIPYLCCSDCPPVAYILPTPPKPILTISVQTPICSDVDPVEINIGPDNTGQVTSDKLTKALIPNNGKWTFDPSKLFPDPSNIQPYVLAGLSVSGTLVYSIGDVKSAPFPVTVLRHPIADFRYKVNLNEAGKTFVILEAESEVDVIILKYDWTITPVQPNPEITLPSLTGSGKKTNLDITDFLKNQVRQVTISLVVNNEGCKSSVSLGPFDWRKNREGVSLAPAKATIPGKAVLKKAMRKTSSKPAGKRPGKK